MFEDLVKSIKEPTVSDEAKDVATDLMCPVPDESPLTSDTAEYINDIAKETYGDDTELIQTQEELKQANAEASLNAAREDSAMSLQRSLQKIVAGEYNALDLQREAFLDSLRLVNAEDNPAYGLAIENSRQLQTDALLNNPDILAEDPDITADYNRVLTNRNMLAQARKELVPHGLFENIASIVKLPGVTLKTYTELDDTKKTAENLTELAMTTEKALGGLFDNVVTTTLGFVPFYDSSLRIAAASAEGIKEWNPAAAELLHYAYWQNAIENDSNDKFKDRLSKYVQYLKDDGRMDGEIDLMLNSIEDPSPLLASFGFSFDIGASVRPFLKFTSKAAGMFMKALKGSPKGTADAVIKAAEEASKGAEQITEVDLQKALKEVGVITDPKTGNAVSFPSEPIGITLEGLPKTIKVYTSEEASKVFPNSVVKKELYHGTSQGGFDSFSLGETNFGLFGHGHYATEDIDIARSYTKKGSGTNHEVYRLYMNIKKPLDMDAPVDKNVLRNIVTRIADTEGWIGHNVGKSVTDEEILKMFTNMTISLEDSFKGTLDEYLKMTEMKNKDAFEILVASGMSEVPVHELQELWAVSAIDAGYDGMTHIGGIQGGRKHRVWIAFDDDQVAVVSRETPRGDVHTVGESEKVTQSLEDYLRTTDFKNTDDLTTAVGRKLAARDEVGAAQDLIKTVQEGSRNNKNVIRVIANDFFDSAMKSVKNTKSISHLDDIMTEKDYVRVLGQALTDIERHSANGLTGLRQDLLRDAMTGLADSLESERSLYRTSGISDVLRSHYNDVVQESSKGDLFALVRTNKFFTNQEAAKSYATKLKSDNVETFVMPTRGGKDTVDGWAVDAKVKLNKGFGSLIAEKHPGDYRNLGFSAVYTTTSNPDYVRLLNTGRETEAAHLRELETSAQRAMAAAKGSDKELLQTLIDQSVQDGAFYTQDYLNSKGVSQTVKDAYNSYRLMNDVDMFLINQSRHDDMVAQGLKALKLGDSSLGYGRIKRSEDILSDMKNTTKKLIVGDVKADPVAFGDLDMTEEAIKNKISEGWVLVERAFGPDEFTDAASVMYFLPGHNLVENPIPNIVTNYVAGGRRFFSRTAGYVKQAVMKKGKAGRDVITGVQSFATDEDAIGLAKKTKKIEQIRKAVVPMFKSSAYDDAEVVKLIQELQLTDVPFTDARSFAKWAQSRGIDLTHLDNSLEVVRDGEMIPSYSNLKLNYDSAVPEEELERVLHRSAFQAMTQEAKMQKWRRTGKDLLAYNFQDTAKIVDFDKQMQYMLQDMVNARVMGKYTDFIAEDFMKRFGPNAALHDAGVIKNAAGKNARQLLNSVHSSADVIDNSIRSQRALVAAKNYRAIRGIPTDADAAIADWYKKAMTAIGEKTPIGIDNLAHKLRVTNAAISENLQPAHWLRWNTATHFMGLLNGRQLITQSMPILYTFLAKPVALGKSLRYIPALTQELISSKGSYSKAMERFIAKEGLKSDHMKAVWKAMIDARIFENTSYAGAFESAKAGSKWEALDRINFAPKNFAEVLNRVVAHATAYEDLGFGSKGIQTAEDMMRFKSLGNSLYINMDATGMSRLQTSETAKVLTQFWSANARWWETVLRDTNLTRSERWRIGTGVLALTGGAGIIGINNTRKVIDRVKDIYNYFNPEEENPVHFTEKEMSWVERTFERGILAWASDNYDWSETIALPFTDLLDNLAGLFDKPLESVPSLAVLDRQTELVKDLYRSAYVVRHSNDSYDAWKAALKVMATSKGLPSATKQRLTAAILWNQGMRWNTKGQLTQEDATQLDAVMALIGVPRMEATDISAAFVSNQHESAKVKEFVEETKRYWNIWKDTHDEGVWALWTTLLHNAPLTDAQKIAAEKELLKDTEYDTVITELKRRILYEMKHPDAGTYLIQLTNLERKQI